MTDVLTTPPSPSAVGGFPPSSSWAPTRPGTPAPDPGSQPHAGAPGDDAWIRYLQGRTFAVDAALARGDGAAVNAALSRLVRCHPEDPVGLGAAAALVRRFSPTELERLALVHPDRLRVRSALRRWRLVPHEPWLPATRVEAERQRLRGLVRAGHAFASAA